MSALMGFMLLFGVVFLRVYGCLISSVGSGVLRLRCIDNHQVSLIEGLLKDNQEQRFQVGDGSLVSRLFVVLQLRDLEHQNIKEPKSQVRYLWLFLPKLSEASQRALARHVVQSR
ncbi:hypothetical protein [Alteromonas oceanisediminis]|uniref:hypothetical protein n=1 Tax=Alteromonas oceanisediminis TaxID=2836180 RepID=UPI001BDA4F60|nr:hypothetical protein [Alteromonas oceanisediminis]MBT0585793.1 hypothetical protein [Alteromonas oceanisediminis]